MKKLLLSAFVVSAITLHAQTWTTQNSNFPAASTGVTNISIVDANTAWAFGYDGAPLDGTHPETLNYQAFTKTSNAGATWTAGTINLGNTTLLISDLEAVSATTAYVMASKPTSGSGGGVWQTTDGGATWNKQTTATFNLGTSFPNVVKFFDANNGFLMGDSDSSGVFELYTTSNGGTNWTKVPAANIPPAPNEFGYVHLKASVGNTIWFGTDHGRVFKSNDKGLTWTVSQTPIVDFGGITTEGSTGVLTLKDANTGWIIDQDATIYKTTNAGVNWVPLATTGTIFPDGVAFVPGTSNTLISTGAQQANFGSSISIDGGENWTVIEQDSQKTSVSAFDANTVYSGGYNASPTVDGIYKLSALLATSEASSAKNAVSVYPNPTKGQLNLVTKSKIATIQVLDMSGKAVKNFSKISQLDLSGLQSGVYLLKVTMEDGSSSVTKVVRN